MHKSTKVADNKISELSMNVYLGFLNFGKRGIICVIDCVLFCLCENENLFNMVLQKDKCYYILGWNSKRVVIGFTFRTNDIVRGI